MHKPVLTIVAGCNGSGKSTFSKLLVDKNVNPFDYDYYYLKFYRSLRPSDVQETMAHNMAFEELERQVADSVAAKISFCYETNFNSTPLHWPSHFKKTGYTLHMIYLCLDSINEAQRRVKVRVDNGGHFVAEEEIRQRYYDGFENLNANYTYFDIIDVFDASGFASMPSHLFSVREGRFELRSEVPQYLQALLPSIFGQAGA